VRVWAFNSNRFALLRSKEFGTHPLPPTLFDGKEDFWRLLGQFACWLPQALDLLPACPAPAGILTPGCYQHAPVSL